MNVENTAMPFQLHMDSDTDELVRHTAPTLARLTIDQRHTLPAIARGGVHDILMEPPVNGDHSEPFHDIGGQGDHDQVVKFTRPSELEPVRNREFKITRAGPFRHTAPAAPGNNDQPVVFNAPSRRPELPTIESIQESERELEHLLATHPPEGKFCTRNNDCLPINAK